ncbi:hypothetical protein [Dactylosporangium sp. CA-139066]|uniref:hypothetical protein n=1 Tax=Dactylosporangium sp. CA-139066 TaxID=3239930 RepID=UPI003D94EF40
MAPTPQPGIFAAALAEHAYLEFDRRPETSFRQLLEALTVTRYTHPLTGAYYVIPPVAALQAYT